MHTHIEPSLEPRLQSHSDDLVTVSLVVPFCHVASDRDVQYDQPQSP
jgi:hypothetical protein